MRRWIGAAAATAAILAAPSAALAGADDPAQLQFKLPSIDAIAEFESLGAAADHGMTRNSDGSVNVNAWLTDEQLAVYRAHGYQPVATLVDKFAIDSIRAERNATLQKLKAAKDALRDARLGIESKRKSLADGDIHAQRADYWENNVGRFLSIEANADGAHYTGDSTATYVGPSVTAEWFAGAARLGGGDIGVYSDGDPFQVPRHYQYHYSVFRLGDKGDGLPVPTSITIASSNGSTDTLAVREWIAKDPPKPTAPLTGFVTHYNDSQEAYQKVRDLAAEFPNISEAIKLPEPTTGYQRRAQTMLGYTNVATTPYITFDAGNRPVAGGTPPGSQQGSVVVLSSEKMGHLGGNSLAAQIVAPAAGATNQSLSVALNGSKIDISPATDGTGAVTSTAAQVADAINAHPQVSTLVKATPFRTNAGAGVVVPGASSPLSDMLRAPATFPRGPQDQYLLRVGKQRDGSKVGVFFYCQEHGNEIATSGVCLETMERLVRNYGTDPQTTALVDNLDIFILPQINGDGATHSLYDSNRRKNLSNYCEDTAKFPTKVTDPASRNSWGVDMNRNFQIGSIFDEVDGVPFQGASSTNCTSGNFAGPFEHSEPEVRNETWVQTTFDNIKFANNIHSNGGLFMWPPGAYTETRVPLPYPPYGTLNFFDQTGKAVLDGIKSHRGTGIRPQSTGPVIDVLYSAAGNSADEAYYANGIIGFDFEIGTTNYYIDPVTGVERTCGASQQPPFGDSTNDCLDNEGFHEAMEYASGNYGMLEAAMAYGKDTTPPDVDTVWGADGITPTYEVRFTSDEAASIYYTTDGSTPTTASTEWKPPRPRALPLPLELAPGTTLKWIAHDYKGNLSAVKSQAFGFDEEPGTVGGDVPATLSLTLGAPASFGAFQPGVHDTYTATTTANVISTAGDATLDVTDPSSTATGHLVNGTFSLAEPLMVAGHELPATVKTYDGPVSNDAAEIEFSQEIGENEPLRTGTYSKTLTFTLSTTTP